MPPKPSPDSKWVKCKTCHGAGIVSHGTAEYITTCTTCAGIGSVRRRRRKKVVPLIPILPSGDPGTSHEDQYLLDYLDGIG